MKDIIRKIVANPKTHARWINTLSMMENAGAKKIKNCEHPIFVNEIILKHAAEEARHAYYLKKQIKKVAENACPTYERSYLLAPLFSYYYLHTLDIRICRHLKSTYGIRHEKLKYAAYLLVTYAIEVRADELYPIYQSVLTETNSRVNVKSIIAEEINHLREMEQQLKEFSPKWQQMCTDACTLETALHKDWAKALDLEVKEG